MEKLGIGIIGLGIISDAHERGIAQAADIAKVMAVCDIDLVKAQLRAKKYDASFCSDYHNLLSDPSITVVDIILPHHLHYQVARDCIKAGKHILIEKPLTLSSSSGAELIDLAKEKGVIFSVAENTRFQAHLSQVDIVDAAVKDRTLILA